jgi:ABC-type transport system substrate-binding protein
MQALQEGEVDIIGYTIDPSLVPMLSESQNIEVATTLRNGYGFLIINCQKYPYNLTAFRRALAFAMDKNSICDDIWDGFAEPLDSLVPKINPFSIEGQLPYSYYDADVQTGNNLLDVAGFSIDEDTGLRNAPNGEPFHVLIEVQMSGNLGIDIGIKTAEAFEVLNINATAVPTDFYEVLQRCYHHRDFDIIFLGNTFNHLDVDWLAYEFWSEYVNEPFHNLPNFLNSTYDSWRDQLLHSTDYDEIYEAAIEMQRIWVYQCPEIILYENLVLSAYRTDRFEGVVNDVLVGVPNWWTNYKTHLKTIEGGPFGGTLTWAFPLHIDAFNFMTSCSCSGPRIYGSIMYDSLLRRDPIGNNLPWLARSYSIATNDDNPDVTQGNTRFTFNIIRNASWTDGVPLTAEDVAFTMNFYRDAPGNPHSRDFSDLRMAVALTPYQVVFEFESESYWHLRKLVHKPIIPKHVFTGMLNTWNQWNPIPPVDPMVTSGPFNVSEYVPGSHTTFARNPNYFFDARNLTDSFEPSYPHIFDTRLSIISGIITGGAIGVIIAVIILWRKSS